MTIYKKVIEYFHNLCYSICEKSNYRKSGVFMKENKGNTKIDIFSVANFFLNIVDRDSESTITPLKLQKILYYAQGYYLARKGKELFKEDFEAWAHGPANPKIYEKYKDYAGNVIDSPKDEDIPIFSEDLTDFLYSIWDVFGIFDGKYLENLTHQEAPWLEARNGYKPGEKCNVVIKKESMKRFFQTEPYNV